MTRAVKIAHRDIFGGLSPFSAPLVAAPKFGLSMPTVIAKLTADTAYTLKTTIPWDDTDTDALSMLNSDGTIFLPATGVYSVVLEISLDATPSGSDTAVSLALDGVSTRVSRVYDKDSTHIVHATYSTQLHATRGQTLQSVIEGSSGTLGSVRSYLAVTLVSQTA